MGVLGVSSGFSFGASGWHTEAPTLHYSVYHAFLPWISQGLEVGVAKGSLLLLGHLLDEGGHVG